MRAGPLPRGFPEAHNLACSYPLKYQAKKLLEKFNEPQGNCFSIKVYDKFFVFGDRQCMVVESYHTALLCSNIQLILYQKNAVEDLIILVGVHIVSMNYVTVSRCHHFRKIRVQLKDA